MRTSIIYTRKGEEIIVPKHLYEMLSQHKWYLNADGYGVRNPVLRSRKEARETGSPRQGAEFIHRRIVELEYGICLSSDEQVDHRDRDPLNNSLNNLRVIPKNHSGNAINVGLRKDNTTGYKGVRFKKSKDLYEAYVNFRGKRYYAGGSKSVDEAAKLYDAKAKELHGDFAFLNSIDGGPA